MNTLKKPTVIVGIAAYNAERNILRLLSSLLKQKEEGFILEKVVVHSDQSSDDTIKKVKSLHSRKVETIESASRKGFTGSVKTLLDSSQSDIVVLLNDDIYISDDLFLRKAIAPIVNNHNVGLSSVALNPLKPRTFVERAVKTGYEAYAELGKKFKDGDNILTCDGKVLILTRTFNEKLTFPKDLSQTGNLDTYLYMSCIKHGLSYAFAKNAFIGFRFPSTISDFLKWQKRNYLNKSMLHKSFGEETVHEYSYSKATYAFYKLKAFLRNPLGGLLIVVLGAYCALNDKFTNEKFQTKWDLVKSTK